MESQSAEKQKEPAAQRRPPPEENPRLKCRDCGAFGHTVRSRKCPIKCWDGAKAPLPLGVKKEKENRDPQKKPQNPQSSEPETEREREERERLEKRKKALLLRFPKKPPQKKPASWKDTTHSGDYLRRPSRPAFICINRQLFMGHTQGSVQADEESDGQPCHAAPSTEDTDIIFPLEEEKCQTWDVLSVPQTASGHGDEDPAVGENPTDQSIEYCFYQVPEDTFQVQEMDCMFNMQSEDQHTDEDKHFHLYSAAHTDSQDAQDAELSFKVTGEVHTQVIQNSTKRFRLSFYQTPKKSTKRPMLDTSHPVPCCSTSSVEPTGLPQGANVEEQPPHNTALLNFTQPYTEFHHPLASHVPVQSLRMVFTRLKNDCWSSKILETSSYYISKKKITPGKISLFLKRSGGPSSWVPRK
ncbi:putative protein FAM90A26 [Mus caroli]|uniref:Zinc knuckle domain-containing protein n=1 Tax=Mus caroli TaxID=10089 RepID=A0A6P7QKR4_MUSCR|nr:putative protein FAM90A26 [Mus caroli]